MHQKNAWRAAAAVFGALLVSFTASAAGERQLPERAVRIERAAILDPSGQARPMVAATMFLPHGWRAQGGVEWGPQYACTYFIGLNWNATSPDGRSRLAWYPAASWEQNNTGNPTPTRPGCTMQPFTDARGYLGKALELLFPGARMLDYRPRRDLARPAAPVTRAGPGGMQITHHGDAGQLQFAFQQGGTEMRGVMTVGVSFETSQAPTPGIGVLRMSYATTDALFVATAPAASFDAGLADALRGSFQLDPAWTQVLADHVQKINRINLDGIMDRQRIWRANAQQMSQMINDSWQAGQRSGDRRALAFSQALRDVETYRDPQGRATELNSGFAGAWRLDDGSYLMSRDPGFDPWRDAGLRGQRLEPQR